MSESHAAEPKRPLTGKEMFWYSVACVVCVAGAGFFVGLQIALFSIDRLLLRVLTTTGTPKERKQAESLLRVLKLQHWTLVALVLMNAVFVMTLPILLECMFDEITALIVSITAVLFAGEVVPLAVFVRWAIPVCSYFIQSIWFAIIVTAPVSYPMGKVLDRVLGHSEEPLDREDLAALIVGPHLDDEAEEETGSGRAGVMKAAAVRTNEAGEDTTTNTADALAATNESRTSTYEGSTTNASPYQLRESEVKMLQAAMLLSTDTVKEHLNTHTDDAFMLSSRDTLDRETILRILKAGYSRVPVYFGEDKRHIIGALIVNSLISLCYTCPDPPPVVSDYPLREVMRLSEESSLYNAYLAFRNGLSNMAVIYDSAGMMVGLLTLNDVLATLYNAEPVAPVSLTEQYLRRQHKMVELVEGMKFLQATKRVVPMVLGTTRPGGPEVTNVQTDAPQDQIGVGSALLPQSYTPLPTSPTITAGSGEVPTLPIKTTVPAVVSTFPKPPRASP
jgi:metal transporter CNNM